MKTTDIWKKYEKCKSYVDGKQIVAKTEKNWNFFIGKQWEGLQTGGENYPMLNFIKPVVQYKVSTVAQNAMTAIYSDINSRAELDPIYQNLNKFWEQCWEKAKMNQVAWKILKAGAIQGDSYVYWENADTTKPPVILPNTSIFLADENIDDIQNQPYVIIYERWSLDEVKAHAKKNGVSEEDIKTIATDNETAHQILNRKEVEDKVSVLFYMEKKNGVVKAGRATRTLIIEPIEEIKGAYGTGQEMKGLNTYSIIPYVWENVPNTARGVGEVEQLIPNQLELNKTLARRSMATSIGAYPRLAYDVNAIENPEDLEKVGVAIAVNGGAQSINQMISYLNATNISSDADKLSNDLLQITKDLAGASDTALGNINPEQASGQAIIAVRDQAQVPLNEQVARYKQWVEDVSLLWVNLWIAYHPDGITFQSQDDMGQTTEITISQEELRNIEPTVRVDVSPDNQWTKLSEQQCLDNMLMNQQITFEEYVEASPESGALPKAKLIKLIEKRKAQQKQMAQQEQMAQEPTEEYDIEAVLQELIAQGVPEDEALAMVQGL